MEYKLVKIKIVDHIAFLSLARLDSLNAVNQELATEIMESVKELDANNEVRVIVLKSDARIFCAGIDLKFAMTSVMADTGSSGAAGLEGHVFLDCCNILEQCRKPVIAAVHGACVGAGLDMISACDIRLCADDATFSIRESGIGLVADMGSLQRLPLIIGQGFTREMAYTARFFTAREVERMRLINAIYPDRASLYEAVEKLARQIAINPPLGVQSAKELLNASRYMKVEEAMSKGGMMNRRLLTTEDFKEAAMAFVEKRKPAFKGK
jgi:enoyl-CoA hydratase